MSNLFNIQLETYKGLKNFLFYRRIETKKWLTDEQFMKNIMDNNYVKIIAFDTKDKVRKKIKSMHDNTFNLDTITYICIVDAVDTKKIDDILLKLLSGICKEKNNVNRDVIIVTDSIIGKKTNNTINQFKSNGTENTGYVRVTIKKYAQLIINIFANASVSSHRILSSDEEKDILERSMLKKLQLQKIYYSDPAVFMIGAEVNDVIEIKNYNEHSGIDIKYRVVH